MTRATRFGDALDELLQPPPYRPACDGCGTQSPHLRAATLSDGREVRVCMDRAMECLERAIEFRGAVAPARVAAPGPAQPRAQRRTEEQDLQDGILAYNAHLPVGMRWEAYHTLDSRGSARGWPDLVLAREPNELLFRELKSEAGRVSAEQRWWLVMLAGVGLDAAVWRPRHWPEIEARLSMRRPSSVAVADIAYRVASRGKLRGPSWEDMGRWERARGAETDGERDF